MSMEETRTDYQAKLMTVKTSELFLNKLIFIISVFARMLTFYLRL